MSSSTEYRLHETDDECVAPTHGIGEHSDSGRRTSRPKVLIYRNDLIERSETFIVAQTASLQRYDPVFCGLTRCKSGILSKSMPSAVLSSEGPLLGNLRKQLFMATGIAPSWKRRCRALEGALMHAHFAVDAAFALPLCRALDLPLVVSLHGYDVTSSDDALHRTRGGRIYLRHREELLERTQMFLCVSEFIRQQAIARGYPKEKLHVHSIGIDLKSFYPTVFEEREPLVLFVGRLVEKKGCVHLIRAMRSVQLAMPEAKLVIIGDGKLRQELQETAAAVLPGKYLFLGSQPTHVVHTWLRRARVFSVPSVTAANGDREGLGMVFCEAQAMGVPVVSFASGGIPEAVLDSVTGYLLTERDERGLSLKICDLLQDRLCWGKMSANGQRRMAAKFDLNIQTRILEARYDEILKFAR